MSLILLTYMLGCIVSYYHIRWIRGRAYLGTYDKPAWIAWMTATWPLMVFGFLAYWIAKILGKKRALAKLIERIFGGMRVLDEYEVEQAERGLVVGVCTRDSCNGLMLQSNARRVAFCSKCSFTCEESVR